MTTESRGHQVVMPKLGLTMTEATIVEWLRNEGDHVRKGDPLFVLETEKTTLEIEAPASGTLSILVPAGQMVPVQQLIAMLLGDEAVPPIQPEIPVATAATPQKPEGSGSSMRSPGVLRASPKARALARQLGIPLDGVTGTGARGMIVARDVEQAAASRRPVKMSPVARKLVAEVGLDPSTVSGTGPSGRVMRGDVEQALADQPKPAPAPSEMPAEIQPFDGLRAVIAGRLTASWRDRPHVTLITEAEATNLVSARQQAIAELGAKVSYDAFLVALVARALREHPQVNVRLSERGIERLATINVGVAVDTKRGLLVPVVRDAASKTLRRIQGDLQDMMDRALAGRSLPDDLSDGTFTITNLGMFDIDAFTPIINPPESAILGVGRIFAKPVAREGQVVIRDMMALSLSFDHRLLDGAPAARFLQRVKQLVERPFTLAMVEREP